MDTAVVTGAGRGIGREIARLLAGRGLAVLSPTWTRPPRAKPRSHGGRAWSMPLDVRDAEAHRARPRPPPSAAR